ncbi:MAG: hypothetical protein COA77_06370 [Thaumarchaeota archaeon]|nr:MAG: hypothetical protein COA77_06370 [Nitrososphaerota archaeon]
MSNQIELGEIIPYHFGKKLMISLDERWNEYFTSKNISFKVVINDNKLILVGPKVSGPTKSQVTKQGISNFE